MSHCKACDGRLYGQDWSYINKDNEGLVPEYIEEDLCRHCHTGAKDAYTNLLHSTAAEIEYSCRKMFYKEFANVTDPLAGLVDLDYDCITPVEIYGGDECESYT